MNYGARDEKRLIELARKGDHDAYSALFDKYDHLVLYHANRIVNDPDKAKGLTAETREKGWLGFAGFKGGSFRAWIVRIGTNLAKSYIRPKKNKRAESLTDEAYVPETPRVTGDPLKYLLTEEMLNEIEQDVGAFPEPDKTVLWMLLIERESVKQIMRGLPGKFKNEQQIRHVARRGLKRLRRLLVGRGHWDH